MEGWQIALVFKALGLVVLFSFVRFIAMGIHHLLPDGRVKRFLFLSWKV